MNSARPRNLRDLVRMAHRHKMALILPALVITVACGLAIWLMPVEYMSSAAIFAEPSKTAGRSNQAPDLLLTHLRQQATDRAAIIKLIDRQDLFRQAGDKGINQESMIADVRVHIGVDLESVRDQQGSAFRISFRAPGPETARRVTADLVDRIISEGIHDDLPGASAEVDALRKRTNELSSKLRELEGRGPWLSGVKQLIQPSAGSSAPRSSQPSVEALRTQQMNVESLKDQKYKLEQQIADSDKRIAAQRQIVDSQKKTSAPRDNPTYALLISRRTELQGQRNNLLNRQELTDKHPRVLAITDQIAAINTQLEELRKQDASALSQTPEARELLALESERRKMQLELEVTGREISRRTSNPQPLRPPTAPPSRPLIQSSGSTRLSQEYRILKQDYDDSVEKLKDAQSRQEAGGGAKMPRFRLSEPASLPQNPYDPGRLLLGLLAAAIGLAVGACFVFLLDLRRHRTIQDAGDVEYYTRLPMLAAIPATLAPTERQQIEQRSRMLLAAGVAGAVVATVALTKLLIVTELFTRIGNR